MILRNICKIQNMRMMRNSILHLGLYPSCSLGIEFFIKLTLYDIIIFPLPPLDVTLVMATIFRKDKSRAHWINEMGMAEVVENKGKLWRTMGVVRSGKVYYSIEETLYVK